jgi:hypothetical protein
MPPVRTHTYHAADTTEEFETTGDTACVVLRALPILGALLMLRALVELCAHDDKTSTSRASLASVRD